MEIQKDESLPGPDDLLHPIMTEAKRVLDEMGDTKDLAQRKNQSEILKNLCQSAGVFFELMADSMHGGFSEMDDMEQFFEDE